MSPNEEAPVLLETTRSQTRRLSLVLMLNLLIIGALVIVGLASNSLSVLAAGGDFAVDTLAIGLGLMAVRLRARPGGSRQAPTYVALLNGSLLLLITLYVGWHAIDRLSNGAPEVAGLPILIVSAISAGVMVLSALILGRSAASEDLHMHSVLLDTLADALAAAAVAVAGLVILLANGLYWLDPLLALVMGVVITYGAMRLLLDVARALRTGTELELDDD